MDSTTFLAIYGACLSTLTAIAGIAWTVYTYRKSQPSLIVSGKLVMYQLVNISVEAIEIDVTNSGQSTVTVSNLRFKATATPDRLFLVREAFFQPDTLPKQLTESQPMAIVVRKEYLATPDEVEYLFAEDTAGRVYKSKRMPLRGQRYPTT